MSKFHPQKIFIAFSETSDETEKGSYCECCHWYPKWSEISIIELEYSYNKKVYCTTHLNTAAHELQANSCQPHNAFSKIHMFENHDTKSRVSSSNSNKATADSKSDMHCTHQIIENIVKIYHYSCKKKNITGKSL